MEELILHYYLKVFSVILFFLLLIFSINTHALIYKDNNIENNIINISKGETILDVIDDDILEMSNLDQLIIKIYYRLYQYFTSSIIHYGDFHLEKKISIYEILNIISKPSNILNKITIIEGWSKNDLNKELSKYFKNYSTINYTDILADTYYFEKNKDFEYLYNKMLKFKKNYFNKFSKNKFFDNYSEKDAIIIGSLIEKEGTDYYDKRMISSVIFNRLNINMKLQIDATVLFAITNGNYVLNRKLNLNDLKIDNSYNTYKYKGLTPSPISYVGTKTIDIIMEDYKSDYLFYFYNDILKKHIFSKNFNEHKKKLNEFRNQK